MNALCQRKQKHTFSSVDNDSPDSRGGRDGEALVARPLGNLVGAGVAVEQLPVVVLLAFLGEEKPDGGRVDGAGVPQPVELDALGQAFLVAAKTAAVAVATAARVPFDEVQGVVGDLARLASGEQACWNGKGAGGREDGSSEKLERRHGVGRWDSA